VSALALKKSTCTQEKVDRNSQPKYTTTDLDLWWFFESMIQKAFFAAWCIERGRRTRKEWQGQGGYRYQEWAHCP
jgi:hypothetical protein